MENNFSAGVLFCIFVAEGWSVLIIFNEGNMAFRDLNISKQILMALEEAGFEQPTPIQEQAFPVIRSGKDMIGIAQTGTGKTLAYLIPLLMKLHYAQGSYCLLYTSDTADETHEV